MQASEFIVETVFDIQEQHIIEVLGDEYAQSVFESFNTAQDFSEFISQFGVELNDEQIGETFFPVAIRILPQSEFISLAHFLDNATLTNVVANNYMFAFENRKQTFPPATLNTLSYRTIFRSKDEFHQFETILNLKYSTWRIQPKIL